MYFEQLGHIGEEQMNWIKEQMELSKRDGKIAILMSHHPLIPHRAMSMIVGNS